MDSEQIILQKIIQAGLLNEGDQICFKNEQGKCICQHDIPAYTIFFHNLIEVYNAVGRLKLSLGVNLPIN
jgi:hypothetical protein